MTSAVLFDRVWTQTKHQPKTQTENEMRNGTFDEILDVLMEVDNQKAKKYTEVCNAVYRLVELEMVHVDEADVLLMSLKNNKEELKEGVTLKITQTI